MISAVLRAASNASAQVELQRSTLPSIACNSGRKGMGVKPRNDSRARRVPDKAVTSGAA